MRNYDVEERVTAFGRALFRTQDLDPVYVAVPEAIANQDQLARWLVSYWCFYSCGAASWLSERDGNEFWRALMVAAENQAPTPFGGRWPRGAERRHFRGAAAVKAVGALQRRYGPRPEDMVACLLTGRMDVRSVIARAEGHHLFGPWIAFKIADMLDAVWGTRVKQDDLTAFLYETPRKSILENCEAGRLPIKTTDSAVLEKAMRWLGFELADCEIPHKPGQAPDWFCLETVWCKHHSHLTGHYPLYNDINEIRRGLQPWLKSSPTAHRVLAAMPAGTSTSIKENPRR